MKKSMIAAWFAVPLACLAFAGLSLPATALAGTPQLDASVDALKGHKRVVIAEFGVEFFTQMQASSVRGTASAKVVGRLTGVDDTDFQAITDKAYADTVTALQQAGFEVLDPAVLNDNATFRELGAKYGHASPYLNDDQGINNRGMISKIFAPAGMLAFHQSSLKSDEPRGTVRQNIDAQNQGHAKKEGEVAKALDAVLLHVHYVAAFGMPNKKKHNALFSGSTARAKVTVAPMLWAEDTEIQFVTEAGGRTFGNGRMRHNGWAALGDELVSDTDIFTTVDVTSAQSKRSDLIVGAVGALLGGGSAQKTRDGEVSPVSAEAYRATYGSLITDAANAFAARLGAAH